MRCCRRGFGWVREWVDVQTQNAPPMREAIHLTTVGTYRSQPRRGKGPWRHWPGGRKLCGVVGVGVGVGVGGWEMEV